MRYSLMAAIAVATVSGASDARAQESRLRLTLDQALGVASGSNPALRQATASAGLNGAEMRTTWVDQLLPSASLTLFTTAFTGNLQRQSFDNFGNPIANPAAEWNYFSRTLHSLDLSWTFQGPSIFHSHRRQKLVNQDRDLSVTSLYNLENTAAKLNVWSPAGLPIPTTILADREGIVRWIDQSDDYRLRSQPDRVLRALREGLG